jgi:hypothetical protein
MSTAEDYLQFAQMLVNGGELNGKRFLSPRTVELMSSNHVGNLWVANSRLQRFLAILARRFFQIDMNAISLAQTIRTENDQ